MNHSALTRINSAFLNISINNDNYFVKFSALLIKAKALLVQLLSLQEEYFAVHLFCPYFLARG